MQKDLLLKKILSSLQVVDEAKIFNKGDYLISKGDIENNIYYIESGAVRGFYGSG